MIRCNDHDSYDPNLVRKIIAAAKEMKIKEIITTGKDWVKLQELWPENLPLQVAELNISWGEGQTLPELVRERLRQIQ